MSALSQVTLILDINGFRLSSGEFLVRELGWCTIKGENDSQHFYSPLRYRDLGYKDRRTVNYVYRHIHGLRFEASFQEAALPQRDVGAVIQALYHGGLMSHFTSSQFTSSLRHVGQQEFSVGCIKTLLCCICARTCSRWEKMPKAFPVMPITLWHSKTPGINWVCAMCCCNRFPPLGKTVWKPFTSQRPALLDTWFWICTPPRRTSLGCGVTC